MRVIFMGTPEIAVPTLSEIIGRGHDVVAVYTQPPRPAGRGKKTANRPCTNWQKALGLRCARRSISKTRPRWKHFKRWTLMWPWLWPMDCCCLKRFWTRLKKGCLNLHGSLLPRWRGAAPIQRAIMAGDSQTGIMVMKMDKGLDTGDVGLIDEIPVTPNMTAGELHDEMMVRGADMMGRALAAVERDSMDFTPQSSDGVTYAKKIEKSEARIDWTQPAAMVHNQIRGLSPFPGAWFEIDINDKPVRVKIIKAALSEGSGAPGTVLDDDLRIACGEGAILPLTVQREGKGAMDVQTFLRGPGSLKGKVAQ